MAKFITANEAAQLIQDEACVAVGGIGLSGYAEEIICAVRDRFKETGHPRDLNIKQSNALGDWGYGNNFYGWDRTRRETPDKEHGARGITRLGEAGPGLVKKWTSAHIGSAATMNKLASENKLECYCLPQGVTNNLWREIGAGRPGLMTKVGLGTFVDPRLQGGRMNEAAKDTIVEVVNFRGEEYLFYPSFKCDVAILRGTIADEKGNISMDRESNLPSCFAIANAVKNCGGIVIVQVEFLAKKDTLPAKQVIIPAPLVDYVVLAENPMSCWQSEGSYWEPSFSGYLRKPLNAIPPIPFDARKVICRRCAMELKKGDLINLGVGVPADISKVVNEEGYIDDLTMCTEYGIIGGVPSALPDFGSSFNPEAILTINDMFDLIQGGRLNMTCLGIGEIDQYGNNNVSCMNGRLTGPGGFIDISGNTKKVVFAGTLVGKAKYKLGDGKIEVVQEGNIRKFVDKVGQVTFSGQYAPADQEVLYVTERCVFRLIDKKVVLVEIAPGIDLQRDILDQMDFAPEISKDLKTMDPGIFCETWGGLGNYLK